MPRTSGKRCALRANSRLRSETATLPRKGYDDAQQEEQGRSHDDGLHLVGVLSSNTRYAVEFARPGLETPATSWRDQPASGGMDAASYKRTGTGSLDPPRGNGTTGRQRLLSRSQGCRRGASGRL